MSDQWLEPYVIVGEEGKPVGAIEDGDSVLIFNFRAGAPAAESSPEIYMQQVAQPEADEHDSDGCPVHTAVMPTNYRYQCHLYYRRHVTSVC